MKSTVHTGRDWAYVGIVVGAGTSLTANVGSAFLRPSDAPLTWRPSVGAILWSLFWPVALFVAAEIMTRTTWPSSGWSSVPWYVIRFLGLMPITLVAAWVSYHHMAHLLRHYHEDLVTVRCGPLVPDGLMIIAGAALTISSPRRRTRPPAARPTPPATPPDPAKTETRGPATKPALAEDERRAAALLRLDAGEDPGIVAADVRVTTRTLQNWKTARDRANGHASVQ